MSRDLKDTSFSSRRQSHTLTVSSLLALAKKAPLWDTASWFTALQQGQGRKEALAQGRAVEGRSQKCVQGSLLD